MTNLPDTLLILSPAFAEHEGDSWLPAQERFILTVNKLYPHLSIIIISFHFPAVKTNYNWYGNEVIALGGGMKGKWNSLLLWRKAWLTLKNLQQQHNLLGIFSFFCSECAFVGHHFAKRNALQHYIWILGQDAKASNKQVKRIKPSVNELVAISDFLIREFERNHKIKPAHMIPLGLDQQSAIVNSSKRSIDLLGVGSLIPLKQYGVFIEVVKAIQAQLPEVKAKICGDGEEQENLLKQIKGLGLQGNIAMPGKLPHEDIQKEMSRSKILLHTSAYEGFGMVCAEALLAGCHVVSFCKPLNQQFESWHIVASKEEMIAKTLELLQTRSLRYEPVLTYDMEDTAKKIISLFGYKDDKIS
jgi:glycosyltransferase involved in cell wall biosynthesis